MPGLARLLLSDVALFLAGMGVPSGQPGRAFALVMLLRAQAAYAVAPVALYVARSASERRQGIHVARGSTGPTATDRLDSRPRYRPPDWTAGNGERGAMAAPDPAVPVVITVDGTRHTVAVDPRTSLLDLLRERLGVTSPKKGCDHGQCGSCTVLLDGRRHLTCLALAVSHDGAQVVTASGLADAADGDLHPVQEAFVERDALQCGYCTPGQVCSAVGVLDEVRRGWPSHVSEDLDGAVALTDDEVRERMSGNLCRCGAYVNIVAAVRQAAAR